MKVRHPVPCERCKKQLRRGTRAIRMYGRLWCPDCLHTYRARREALRVR